MRLRRGIVLLGCLALACSLFACSDDSTPPADAGADTVKSDGIQVIDAEVDATTEPSVMGEGCQDSTTCKGDAPDCILFDADNAKGICSSKCTPDDPETRLINEDSCPRGFICGTFRFTGSEPVNYCLKTCTPSVTTNPCPASSGQTCDPVSTRYSDLDNTVCWEAACATDKDCPVGSDVICTTDAPCKTALNDNDAFCASNRRCSLPGKCTPGGLCGKHTRGKPGAKVGDSCATDLDCQDGGFCLGSGDGYPNGYCASRGCGSGLPEFNCPAGAVCHRLFFGGFCHKACDQADATSCRNNPADRGGNYECYAWNNLSLGDANVSDAPICAPTGNQACDGLGSTIDCPSLAADPQNNPLKMACRNRETNEILTNMRDPSGFCMDDTASGRFGPDPDGGMPDSGADAGVDSAVPDGAAPDSAAPDSAAPDSAAPDSAAPDSAAPDSAAPDSAAPPRRIAPRRIAPRRIAPRRIAPRPIAARQISV
jgi:hypothetical protein